MKKDRSEYNESRSSSESRSNKQSKNKKGCIWIYRKDDPNRRRIIFPEKGDTIPEGWERGLVRKFNGGWGGYCQRVYCKETDRYYDSMTECSEDIGMSLNAVFNMVKGRIKKPKYTLIAIGGKEYHEYKSKRKGEEAGSK